MDSNLPISKFSGILNRNQKVPKSCLGALRSVSLERIILSEQKINHYPLSQVWARV